MSRNSTIIARNNSNIISTGSNSNVFAYKNIVINYNNPVTNPVTPPIDPPFLCPDGSIPGIDGNGNYFCGGGGSERTISVNPDENSSALIENFSFQNIFSRRISVAQDSIVVVYITDNTPFGISATNYNVNGTYPDGTSIPFIGLFNLNVSSAYYQTVPNGNNFADIIINNNSPTPQTANVMILNVVSSLPGAPPVPEIDVIQVVESENNSTPPFSSVSTIIQDEFNLVFSDALFIVPNDTPDMYNNIIQFSTTPPELAIANPDTDLVQIVQVFEGFKLIKLVQIYSATLGLVGQYPIIRNFPEMDLDYRLASVSFS